MSSAHSGDELASASRVARISDASRPRTGADERDGSRAIAHGSGGGGGRSSFAGEGPDDPLIDVSLLVNCLGFVARSFRRHWIGGVACTAVFLSAVVALLSAWPKTYQVDGRLLVQATSPVAIYVNPGVRGDQGPTLAAQEIVESRDNLEQIMKATNLMEHWQRNRPPLLQFRDRLRNLVMTPPTEEDRFDALVGLLEDRLQVSTTEEGTVAFAIRWPDPAVGRDIVDRAMQSFLTHRRVTESAAITDSIAILERAAATIESDMKSTLEQLPAAPVAGPRPTRRPTRAANVTGPSAESTVRLARLRSVLEDRQREVARLEGVRTQQLAEANARLSAALTIYTEGHPTVATLKQTVARLSTEAPELVAARREAQRVEAEYDELSTRVGVATARAEQARVLEQIDAASPADSIAMFRPSTGEADPVGLRIKNQMTELATVQAKASAARAELASVQAGFKYQYTVVRPPRLPRNPVGPNAPAILGAGLLASLLLGLAYGVARDLLKGRVLEAWQVEHMARAPVSLRVPSL